MKSMIFTVLLYSSHGFAGQFLNDSILPTDLQNEILMVLGQKYPCLDQIREDGTTVIEEPLDRYTDLFYTTVLNVSYLFDGSQSVKGALEVKSAKYDFSNGKNIEVLSILPVGGSFHCP